MAEGTKCPVCQLMVPNKDFGQHANIHTKKPNANKQPLQLQQPHPHPKTTHKAVATNFNLTTNNNSQNMYELALVLSRLEAIEDQCPPGQPSANQKPNTNANAKPSINTTTPATTHKNVFSNAAASLQPRPEFKIESLANHISENVINCIADTYFLKKNACYLKRAHLSSTLDHYHSSRYGIGWDCGYRNLQTLFSSLLNYEPIKIHLKERGIMEVPSIPVIQHMLEDAWRAGYDKQGSEEHAGFLSGTRRWIGAVDVVAVLRSLGIRTNIVDFDVHKNNITAKYKLMEWIFNYFHKRCHGGKCKGVLSSMKRPPGTCPVCSNTGFFAGKVQPRFIPPLFLQHQGHSRSVIGVEKYSDASIQLIILDTNDRYVKSLSEHSSIQELRVGLNSPVLNELFFQVAFVPDNWAYNNKEEMEASKLIMNEFIIS